ncbi:MAG TPA: bifunctional adenosylcobinamide kinase/adenosylcobinamide-phosphate guanylyltransferase [Nocardioides sp.]|uniref:bifunctional adenosylcobinamide kinase/adenosylcobinamide-phosphate guanylyltransferase n=1 Tax=Nocardioides sp. TaxID=35761 RepID=UPI002E362A5D|nr:bifunctional adenosylcobinamide kinase/adenosylcobinamide-phosphate guanylyltransferase [Nocardioides sp.]HEX3931104.1 bifunctional adenosylcobinamide kinase/adenosylcobinamide-phosphate guanylyltransferase [Nocardioides sp.]
MRVLVTGGVRSGKSRHAEWLLRDRAAVTYVAPGPTTSQDHDPDWAARVAAHRARRPATWTTVESRDLPAALSTGPDAVLVDCLGTWLTGVLDERGLWEAPVVEVTRAVRDLLDATAAVLTDRDDVVLVTSEVGLGVVPAHRSGRIFRDLLGTVNQDLAAVCDEVHLVVAGRVLRIG